MTLVEKLEALKPFLSAHWCSTDTIDEAIKALSSTDGDDGELVERLLFMADQGDFGRKPDPQDIRRIAANRISSLNARLSEMREALEPFAAKAEYADAIEADDGDYLDSAPLKAGEYRKARAALNLSEGGVSR
jgi:hypothetical protein